MLDFAQVLDIKFQRISVSTWSTGSKAYEEYINKDADVDQDVFYRRSIDSQTWEFGCGWTSIDWVGSVDDDNRILELERQRAEQIKVINNSKQQALKLLEGLDAR